MTHGAVKRAARALGALAIAGCVLSASAPQGAGKPSALIGTWRGTSTCTDRVVAPACRDEIVVYDFSAGAKEGTVHWKADKVIEGRREPMYEIDLAYDAAESCWKGEFVSPRVRGVWCLAADGAHLTGSGRVLPGNETIRRIDVRKD